MAFFFQKFTEFKENVQDVLCGYETSYIRISDRIISQCDSESLEQVNGIHPSLNKTQLCFSYSLIQLYGTGVLITSIITAHV